jgi:hypothetical protein
MRKRCFIIAAIALVVGGFFQWKSYPSEGVIYGSKALNSVKEHLNEKRRERGHHLYGTALDEYKDPYERYPEDVAISRVSYSLVGVMLLVGFLVGPPKEEVVSNKDQNEISS